MRALFVSPITPRQNAVAYFTGDLMAAMREVDPQVRSRVAAIDEPGVVRPYGPEVRWRIREKDPESFRMAADAISGSNADIVSIQHNFDMFGVRHGPDYQRGLYEDHLRPFLEGLQKPSIVTLHTLVPRPSPTVRDAVRGMAELSQGLVVMSHAAADLLVSDYGVKVAPSIIPHGFPKVGAKRGANLREKLGLSGRTIISTLGLVDTRKGIEYMIEAMPKIVERHPEALYLIAGETDPDQLMMNGEEYRNRLHSQIEKLGLSNNIAFLNQRLSQRDMADYLVATDVCVAPYLDTNQITSGTIAYAVGAGKAIVATTTSYSAEVLADGRGILVPPADSHQLAEGVLELLDDPAKKAECEHRTRTYAEQLTWPDVGRRFLDLLNETARVEVIPRRERRSRTRPKDVGLGIRLAENPILVPADIKPSLPELEVVSVFNPAVATVGDETILLLRVAERPRTDIDPPRGAKTIDVNAPVLRLQPLPEGRRRDELIGVAILDPDVDPPKVTVAYIPRDLPGFDSTDSRSVRFRATSGGFTPGLDDYAQYLTQMSHLRVARSTDGVHFTVDDEPAVVPVNHFEEYGVEDARATFIDGEWHVTYVGAGRIGITTHRLTTKDFRTFERKGMMFLPDHKDVAIFPEKINGQYVALTRPMPMSFGHVVGVWMAFSTDLVQWGGHTPVVLPRWGLWDELHTGASCIPFRVPEGWLELYHGVDRNTRYAMGAVLFDANDPTRVLARSPRPILVPSEPYEKSGFFNDTVYSCGHISLDENNERIRMYYGTADTCTAAADFVVRDIIEQLEFF